MADKTTRRVLFLALLGAALRGGPAANAADAADAAAAHQPPRPERIVPGAAAPVRLLRDESGRGYALQAADAPGKEVGAALGAATDCVVELNAGLRERRFTLDIAARPPERLLRAVARQAGARLSVSFRLRPAPASGETHHHPDRPPPFATQHLTVGASPALAPQDLGRYLGTRIEVSDGVGGRARVPAGRRRPLAWFLDHIAAQVRARWETVVRLDARTVPDDEAAEHERMRAHFGDLADLSPAERREELVAERESLERLPPGEQAEGIRGVARDVRSLGTLLQTVPGEHRGRLAPRVHAVAESYRAVFTRLRGERRERFAPVLHALADLQQHLAQIR